MAQWPEKGTGIRLLPNENLDSFYFYRSRRLPGCAGPKIKLKKGPFMFLCDPKSLD